MNFLFPENQKILEKLNQKEFELDSLTLAHSYLSDEYERVLNSKVRLILPGTYNELKRPSYLDSFGALFQRGFSASGRTVSQDKGPV